MPFAIAVAVILALLVTMWIVFAKEPGPGPADVAIAYEGGAGDHLDFDLLYDLSGGELRDGLRRDQFVAAKKAAYAGTAVARLGAEISVDDVIATAQTAIVATRVDTDEGSVQNSVTLEKRATGWMVVGYSIRAA